MTALLYIIVIALFVWHMMRRTGVSVARLWVRPALLVLFSAVAIWTEPSTQRVPDYRR